MPNVSNYQGEAVIYYHNATFKAGEVYTISFDVDDRYQRLNRIEIGLRNSDGGLTYVTEEYRGIYDPDGHYNFTFTIPDNIPSNLIGELWIYCYHNFTNGGWSKEENLCRITKAKLELGDSATEWCPATTEVAFKDNLFSNSKSLDGRIGSEAQKIEETSLGFTAASGNNSGLGWHSGGFWNYREILQFSNLPIEENSVYTLSFFAKGQGSMDCYFYGPGIVGEYPRCLKAVSS
jgi:hypothetical protein